MVPRGEVGLIVASVGLAAGIVTPAVYGMVVFVVIVSTLVVPPVLPWTLALAAREEA
jgi:Kef-type K+ transport system membrane component KefB